MKTDFQPHFSKRSVSHGDYGGALKMPAVKFSWKFTLLSPKLRVTRLITVVSLLHVAINVHDDLLLLILSTAVSRVFRTKLTMPRRIAAGSQLKNVKKTVKHHAQKVQTFSALRTETTCCWFEPPGEVLNRLSKSSSDRDLLGTVFSIVCSRRQNFLRQHIVFGATHFDSCSETAFLLLPGLAPRTWHMAPRTW